MRWLVVTAWLLAGSVGAVCAGELTVRVVDTQARVVNDAVVTLSVEAPTTAIAPTSTIHYVDQRDETFVPYVQVLRPGDRVVFRNSDHTRHHAYSFSPVKTFEFMLRPGESSPALALEKTGIVAIGCNIHDHMIAYLVVSGERAQVTTQGRAQFDQLPAGRYTVHVWHPQLRPGHAPPDAVAIVAAAGGATQSLSFTLQLMPDPRQLVDREHLGY